MINRSLAYIGRQYTGQHKLHRDAKTGAYSESLPPITGAALDLQRVLTTKGKKK